VLTMRVRTPSAREPQFPRPDGVNAVFAESRLSINNSGNESEPIIEPLINYLEPGLTVNNEMW
jgi:hypothetical protein